MTTLIVENNETQDILFSSCKTTTPICNDIIIIESTLLLNSNHDQQRNLIGVDKDRDKSTDISLKKNEFQSATISFTNINYVIGDQANQRATCFPWSTERFLFWKPISSKQVLTNVSGIFTPGMNAILGILYRFDILLSLFVPVKSINFKMKSFCTTTKKKQ